MNDSGTGTFQANGDGDVGIVSYKDYFCPTPLEFELGGRLDSTNILTRPELCAITSIGFDHTQLLGDTYEKIASEKAGIIKPKRRSGLGAEQRKART